MTKRQFKTLRRKVQDIALDLDLDARKNRLNPRARLSRAEQINKLYDAAYVLHCLETGEPYEDNAWWKDQELGELNDQEETPPDDLADNFLQNQLP